jgi:hypothetical protein
MRWSLAAVVGLDQPIGGAVEGVWLGAAAGAGYAVARTLASGARAQRATVVAACCAVAALVLSWSGRPLVGGTLHAIARDARGSQISLAPLGRLVGEPDFGPVSQALIAAWEGGIFGLGVGIALLRRRSHDDLTSPSPAAQDFAGH